MTGSDPAGGNACSHGNYDDPLNEDPPDASADVAYALTDSPVGQLARNRELLDRDRFLAHVSIFLVRGLVGAPVPRGW